MSTGTIFRQTWALICRYCINVRRAPIGFFFRSIVAPGIFMAIFIWYLVKVSTDSSNPSMFVEGTLAVLLTVALTMNVQHYLSFMITDKSSGMKSLMISMGLKKISYYLANIICFMLLSLPVVLTVGIFSSIYLFKESQASSIVIVLIFLLFGIHLTAIVFLLNSFLRMPSLSSLIIPLAVPEYFIHLGLTKLVAGPGNSVSGLCLFVASVDPYESIRIFVDSYSLNKNDGSHMITEEAVSESTVVLVIAMLFWIVVTFAFSSWFDEVCPWQTDTAVRGLLYCFGRSTTSDKLDSASDELYERNSNFFEPSQSGRQVGIRIKHVSRKFSNKSVVSDVSFNIYRGETTLLLGHNGAGKTTLMNIILGKLTPSKGSVHINNITDDGELGIGVCPQMSVFDEFLSVRQHLYLISSIKTKTSSAERFRDLTSTMVDISLDKKADCVPSELSGGMKRKLSLGMAFVGGSSVLILDEPSSGLDPDSRVFVWNAIRRYRADRTVLLSTQHMEEADYLGDRIAIMNEGKIICCGSSVFLTNIFGGGYKLRVECLESKRHQIIELVKRHFARAKQSENEHIVNLPDSGERVVDMVLELDDDKSKDMEEKLIQLLEHIEGSSNVLGIKSHGLRSSSIEDVLLNTVTLVAKDKAQSSTQLTLTSTSGHIATLTNPIMMHPANCFTEQRILFVAFMKKYFQTYKNDWLMLVYYRLIMIAIGSWLISIDVKGEWFAVRYTPAFISFALVYHFAHYPITERISGFKTMQMTSSANFILYWFSLFITDLLTVLVTTVIMCLMFTNTFNATGILITSLGMILFGIAGALNCYLLSTLFRSSESALSFIAVYFLIGTIITLLITPVFAIMGKFKSIQSTMDILHMIFIIIYPTDAMRFILHGIVLAGHLQDMPPDRVIYPDLLPPMAGFYALIGQILVFGGLFFLIEYRGLDPSIWVTRIWLRCRCWGAKPIPLREDGPMDQDVVDESAKTMQIINNVPRDTYSLVGCNLSKSYIPSVKVVNHLSFTVKKGECFGLLGVNGAGKSTTFSMLVGAKRPDSGQIWINGEYMDRNRSAYLKKLGYDPQENPGMSLTSIEALFLMARLRCVSEQTIPMLVNSVLEVLDMSAHANKRCNQLSGGTMRKLALGMSLIGNPELLALDEPTAGIDPIARRGVWQLLRSLRTHKKVSIVISSHAMEECEAICDRISIMARGRLRCIGTFLHLRTKFSQGCTVRVQFSPNETMTNFVTQMVPDLGRRLKQIVGQPVKLADTNINSATFNISTSQFKRSALFKLMRDYKRQHPGISYMVNDSSLEDIFITMAKEEQQLEDSHPGNV